MKTDPTEPEIAHAISLLRGVPVWDGRMAVIPIDPLCLWQEKDQDPCGQFHREACVVLQEEDGCFSAHVLVLCDRHAKCMEAGLTRWREMS